jgi:hypothetical protein
MLRFLSARALLRVCALALFVGVGVAAMLLAASIVGAALAHADISVGQAFGAWREYVDAVLSALIIGLVGIVLELIRRKLGISIEDSQRAALQTALTNGAGLALTRLGNVLDKKTVTTGNAAIDEAVNYVMKSAPAAVARFGLTPDQVRQKIEAKLPQVANTTTPTNA